MPTKRRSGCQQQAILDPKRPWKLPTNFEWPGYGYRMSVEEWKALLLQAKAGDAEAEWRVGAGFEEGCKDCKGKIIVRRSSKKALPWFRRAAEHGDASAQNALGIILGNGKTVRKNAREALYWLKKSYKADPSVANNIAVTYREIGNLREAVRWFTKGAATGDEEFLLQLGIHYYWGKGVRKNPRLAVRYFRKVTKGTDLFECSRDDAFFYLGIAYLEGNGVKRSNRMARKMFERANVDNDHLAAQAMLRKM